jgi:beta-aspartyl-peptidase (threonine type)
MDRWGNVAAATSTGGITMKLPGRVGDSPIVGSGCFADNELGGKAFGWAPL